LASAQDVVGVGRLGPDEVEHQVPDLDSPAQNRFQHPFADPEILRTHRQNPVPAPFSH
jgi:hypothetical protein